MSARGYALTAYALKFHSFLKLCIGGYAKMWPRRCDVRSGCTVNRSPCPPRDLAPQIALDNQVSAIAISLIHGLAGDNSPLISATAASITRPALTVHHPGTGKHHINSGQFCEWKKNFSYYQ